MLSQAMKTFLTVAITAVVVGGGVYVWQQNKVIDALKSNQETNNQIANNKIDETVTPTSVAEDGAVTDNKPAIPSPADNGIVAEQPATSGEVYTSKELGYKLTIPEKWMTYNYKIKSIFIPKDDKDNVYGADVYEDVYTADFPDWPGFELLTIGRMPASVWNADIKKYDDAINAGSGDMALEKSLFFQNTIGENNSGQIYFTIITRQDVPPQFDGTMPDLSRDFKIIGD